MHLLEGSAQFYTLILQSRLVCHLLGFRGLLSAKALLENLDGRGVTSLI